MKSKASSGLRAWGARPDERQGRRALVMVVLWRAGRGSRNKICHRALHERILPLSHILRHRNSSSPWLAPLLLVSSALVIALLVWLLATGRAGGSLAHAGLALILGGAAGNALDRLIHGGVTDFLEVRLETYRWPAFNVADSAISIGAVLVLVELLFGGRHRSDSAERDRG